MNCKQCSYFKQSPNFPKHGHCKMLGGDAVQANHPQCNLHKRISKVD